MNTKFELDEHFECFIDEFDEPQKTNEVSPSIIDKFRGKLPVRLLEYWQEYGFSGFGNGLFWLVNPDDYEDVLEAWIGDTEIVEQDSYYIVARSAFGELYLWGEKTGHKYTINTLNGWVIEQENSEQDDSNHEHAIKMFFYIQDPEYIDLEDNNNKPLFDQCKLAHKSLAYDEMYAFEPALFLGGEPILENTAKVNIFAHLTMLASFGQKELLDKDGLIQKAFG